MHLSRNLAILTMLLFSVSALPAEQKRETEVDLGAANYPNYPRYRPYKSYDPYKRDV
ncbi:hypothetical protein EYZ11_005409 [Aspergillus tanneri]|uniref:Uncharacterized protein n=1 Tax=Aspergillus tanneri TaxID=1220188 RepID=A0A4S3JIN5_9EURO|nr:hypothetical protein EYZ11_005409 [Aspergillus tanneri]